MEPFLGQITAFGFTFAPRGWAQCNGQILPINQNQSLFSLLGTTYGGDGRTTFALPDLRGRTPVHQGQGAGLPNRNLGQKYGQETYNLVAANLPSHGHVVRVPVSAEDGGGDEPNGEVLGTASDPHYANDAAGGTYQSFTSGSTGGGASINAMQPFLVVNICIALTGLFPSRN